MKINWKRKLTSRKFWLTLVGFVTTVLVALNINEITIEQIVAIITAGGVLIAYILGESYIDSKHLGQDEPPEED